MHLRTLGQGLEVSAIGLGCMGMSQSYGPNPGSREEMVAVLLLRLPQVVIRQREERVARRQVVRQLVEALGSVVPLVLLQALAIQLCNRTESLEIGERRLQACEDRGDLTLEPRSVCCRRHLSVALPYSASTAAIVAIVPTSARP